MCDLVPAAGRPRPVAGACLPPFGAVVRVVKDIHDPAHAGSNTRLLLSPLPGADAVYWHSSGERGDRGGILCRHPDTDWEMLEPPAEGYAVRIPVGSELRLVP